jgi:hypothetical protein
MSRPRGESSFLAAGRTSRRAFLVALAAVGLRADDGQEIWEVLTDMASALSEGNASSFLRPFDRAMPGYEMLKANVTALLGQYKVQSSIEPVSDEAGSTGHALEFDWLMQIVEQEDGVNAIRRRDRVRCRMVKQGKRWRIVSFEPLAFFAPPEPGAPSGSKPI